MLVPKRVWQSWTAKDDWQPDPDLGWINISSLDTANRFDGPVEVPFKLNVDGLQPASVTEDKQPNRKRVMIFGDSATVGRAVLEQERLAPQLQRIFHSQGQDTEVICAGVQGYSTDQELLLMRRLVPKYRPDVVINMVCDNDFGGNESPVAYGLAKPQFTLSENEGLKLTLPGKEAIAQNWNKPGEMRLRDYLQYSALYRFIRPGLFRLRFGTSWQQDNLVGGGGGHADSQIAALAQADWKLFNALASAMNDVCRDNGAKFILTQHPSVWEVWDTGATPEQRLWLQHKLASAAQEKGFRFCEVVPYFLEHRVEGPFHLLPRDPHCNGKGYELTARCLADAIMQLP